MMLLFLPSTMSVQDLVFSSSGLAGSAGERELKSDNIAVCDYSWGCGGCVNEAWPEHGYASPPHVATHPNTPRNGYPRSEPCHRPTTAYPTYPPKVAPRSTRGRNLWMPGYGAEDRFKGQRCRNVPSPYCLKFERSGAGGQDTQMKKVRLLIYFRRAL
ncbi:hypothetical protein EVAR_27532_1 [Eumeta japonica]|uniref:Uncharacterized protein n=1 Tax=Eumeta variegata TaxID=151549 RepID=A0A4C1W6R5_EUMVA|nr:hypothetical protein EVAR_27532_1 [Eumeta japonica]